ncbi:hypothetical protein [Saccharopolyspora sp. NPDC002376]
MARTALSATTATRTGVAVNPTTTATADGHSFVNSGRRVLVVKNANATTAKTVEIPFGRTVEGQTIPAKVINVPASSTVITAPFGSIYNQEDGSVWVNYTAIADLSVQVLDIPEA